MKKERIYELEPRIMFDAAGAVTVEAQTDTSSVTAESSNVQNDIAPILALYNESLNTSSKVSDAFAKAKDEIAAFMANNGSFEQIASIFGLDASDQESDTYQSLRSLIMGGDYSVDIKILDAETMGVAMAAYSAEGTDGTAVIYVNGDWAATAQSNELNSILIEEIGHSFDTYFNGANDTAGDEGERFAALVNGTLTDSTGLDNDNYTMTVGDVVTHVELANFNFTNAYEMVYDLNNDAVINPAERWADKEQNSHYFNTAPLGSVTIDDGNNVINFSGNDVSAIGINIAGNTYYGWVSRPIKSGGIVRGFYFWTDVSFTNLALAQADGNQDGDSTVTDNRGFLLVVDQAWFGAQITANHTTTTLNNVKDGNLGSVTYSNIGSSSDRVDSALNSLLTPNAVTAVADSLSVNEGSGATSGNLLTNDSDQNGDTFTLTNYTLSGTTYSGAQLGATQTISGIGTINISSTGAYTFTLDSNYSGPVPVITYTITDKYGATSTATFSINVMGVNDVPDAVNDTATTSEDTPVSGNVLGNDTDPDNDPLSVTGFTVTGGSGTPVIGTPYTITGVGTITINANGSYAFTPGSNYNGTVPTITYTISDGKGGTDTATLILTVTAVNDAPMANADNLNGTLYATAASCASGNVLAASTTQSGNVLSNDTDSDITLVAGTTHQITAVTSETEATWSSGTVTGRYGTLTIAANGNYTYTINDTNTAVKALASGEILSETFNYTMSEIGNSPNLTSSSTLRVVIHGSNNGPIANDDYGYVQIVASDSTSGDVSLNDIDYDQNTLSVTGIGVMSTTYSIGDYQNALGSQNGTTATTVKIGIGLSGNTANAPTSTSMTLLTSTSILINGTGGTMTFTFNTLDALNAYKSSNPLSSGYSYYTWLNNGTKQGYVELGSIIASSSNSSITSGSSATSTGTYGSLVMHSNGTYTYTLTNSSLTDTHHDIFAYTLSDGTCSDTANLDITIVGTTNLVDRTVHVNEDPGSPLTGTLTSASSGAITISSYTIYNTDGTTTTGTLNSAISVTGGSLTLNSNGAYSFTPASNYHGAIPTISYTLADGSKASLNIIVDPVNDAPAGTDKTVSLNDKQTYTFSLDDWGFTDSVDNDLFKQVIITTLPTNGTLTLNGSTFSAGQVVTLAQINSGLLVFAPTSNSATDPSASFTFQVQDDGGTSSGGVDLDPSANTFSLNISRINDAPVNTLPSSISTNSYTNVSLSTISTTDQDNLDASNNINTIVLNVTGGILSLTSGTGVTISNNGTGTVTLTATNDTQTDLQAVLATLVYSPTSTFSGTDTLTMTTTDHAGLQDIDSVGIAVSADNRALTVTGTTVNEVSPYVMFEVTGAENQWISLALGTTGTGSTHATMGTDFLPNLQYYNGSSWVDYTGGNIQIPDTASNNGKLLVRTAVLQDTAYEGGETLKLTATNQAGTSTSGNSTIIDDGTASIFLDSNNTSTPDTPTHNYDLDDDRPISVNDITVNEGSPYAVFTVTGVDNQWTKLALSNGTATGSGTDFGGGLEYWNGSAWTTYTANSYIQFDGTTLLVRTPINNDGTFEGSESFFLSASNTGGKTANGMGTILDDGTGTKYPDASPAGSTPVTDNTSLNDDRTLDVVGGLVFNEGSTYATFTVTGMAGYEINLGLGNTAIGTDVDATIASFTFNYSVDSGSTWTTYTWNGTTGNRPMIPGSTTDGGNTGIVLVRVDITSEQESSNANDAYEGAETFTLTATYSTNTLITDTDTDTIIDDGTGRKDLNGDGDITDTNEGDGGAGFENDQLPTLTITNNNGASTGHESVAENVTISGKTFTVSALSGVNKITIGSTDVTLSQLNNAHTTNVVVTTTEGTLTITNYDSGTGVITYSYDPTGTSKNHSAGEVKDDISVSLTDSQGHVVSGTLTILITDTTPTANADTKTVTEGSTVSGNVLTDGTVDDFGADGAKVTSPVGGIIGVRAAGSDTTTAVAAGADGTTIINGTYGYLTMNSNGSYTYHSTQSISADQTDTFVYTIEDTDGDRSTTTLTVSITNTTTLSITVNSIPLVNEGSTYALFMVFPSNSSNSDSVDLTLQDAASGTAATWNGFTTIQFSTDGTTWTTYGPSSKPVGGATVYVRVNITSENDNTYEGPETFGLKASYTSDSSINGSADTTIIDDGTGTKYTGTITGGNPVTDSTNMDDDRTLTVNNITVNEGNGTNYAVFSVGTNAGQTMNLSLSDGTVNPTAISGTDYTNTLEYWNGSAWTAYSAGFTVPGADKSQVTLLVRVPISADNNFENAEDLKLTATYTSGASRSDTGTATIKDDGTGTKFTNGNPTGSNPATDSTNLDDDRSPTASNDSITIENGSSVTIPVRGNDSDPVGGGLTVTGTTNGINGTVTVTNGSPVYTPNPGFSGTDTFTYTITDANGHTSTATVTVNVNETQQPYVQNPTPTPQPKTDPVPQINVLQNVEPDMTITKVLDLLQEQNTQSNTDPIQKEMQYVEDKYNNPSRNEDPKGIQVNNSGRVVLEFAGQHETTQMNVVEVKAFQMDPKFVRIVVKDTQYKEGDAKFEMFALDGTEAPEWIKINPYTGLITGIPTKGVEKVVVQVKIIGNDGKIKTVDVEINVVKKNSVSIEGTLSNRMNHFASQYRSSDELITILNKTAKGA